MHELQGSQRKREYDSHRRHDLSTESQFLFHIQYVLPSDSPQSAFNEIISPTDFVGILRNSLLRQMTHKATCQTCKQFSMFSSRRSIPTRDLPPLLAINACVYSDEHFKFWHDTRDQTFLKAQVEIQGQVDGVDDPETILYDLRVSAPSASQSLLLKARPLCRRSWSKSLP